MINPNPMAIRRRILGVTLRQARQSEGRTKKDVASALGCSPEQIAHYERGEEDIPLPELEALATYLRAPVAALLAGKLTPSAPLPSPEARRLLHRIIGASLRKARLGASKSEEEIAAYLGCAVEEIGQFERGLKPIPALYLDRLGPELGIPLKGFLASPPEETPAPLLQHLPAEAREFTENPDHLPYLRVAMALSLMAPEQIGQVGRALAAVQDGESETG